MNHQIDESIYTRALATAEDEQNKINYFRNVGDSLIIINNMKNPLVPQTVLECTIDKIEIDFNLKVAIFHYKNGRIVHVNNELVGKVIQQWFI